MSDPIFARLRAATPEAIAGWTLGTFGLIALAVTVTSIVESYANLMSFGMTHGMTTWHGMIAPIAVDSFIVLGETMLFGGLLLGWRGKGYYACAVALAVGGFALSVTGNILRDVVFPAWGNRAVQAIWPVTATAALTASLLVLKRLLPDHAAPAARSTLAPAAPRTVKAPRAMRAPRAARLAQLSAAEQALVLELVADAAAGTRLPGEIRLHNEKGIPRRRASKVLDEARTRIRAGGNGHRD